jgi:hypothetical protein
MSQEFLQATDFELSGQLNRRWDAQKKAGGTKDSSLR